MEGFEATIVLRDETADESNPIAGSIDTKGSVKETQGNVPTWKTNTVKGVMAYNQHIKPFVTQAVQHEINTVELRTGSTELQQRAQFTYQVISDGVSIIESIGTGFLIGRGVGAVLGGLVGVTSTVVSYANKADTIRLQGSLEGASLGLMRARSADSLATYSQSRDKSQ